MKYYNITEYFDEETGESVGREEVQKHYIIIKTIKKDVRITAEAITTKRSVQVKRDAQLKFRFP